MAEDPTRYWDLAAFGQDDFRVSPNLTLNVGLRYDVLSPAGGRVGNFDLQRAIVVNNFGPGAVPHAGVQFDKKDFGPRVGFAYSPFGDRRTVIHSAFGMFYAPEGNVFNDLGENPPISQFFGQNFNPGLIPTSQQLISSGFPAELTAIDPKNPTGQVKTTGTTRLMPYIVEWNFNVQRELAPNWLLAVGYVGTRGLRLWDNESSNLDQPPQPLDSNFSDPTGNFGRPYFGILPNLNTIYGIDLPRFDLFYNALAMKLNNNSRMGSTFSSLRHGPRIWPPMQGTLEAHSMGQFRMLTTSRKRKDMSTHPSRTDSPPAISMNSRSVEESASAAARVEL